MAARALVDIQPAPAGSDDAMTDARLGGMDEAAIAALAAHLSRARPADAFDGVWPDHEAGVRAAAAAGTQWRTTLALTGEDRIALKTRFLSLDYAGCAVAWAALGLVVTGRTFEQFQLLEGFMRTLLNGGELVAES